MKNNETLNKYLAGYIDGDGCITTNFYETRNNTYKPRLILTIVIEASTKHCNKLLYLIRDYFNLECSISHREDKNIKTITYSGDTALSIINRIKKHLVIKGTHSNRMIELYEKYKGYGNTCTLEEVEKYKQYVKWSRDNTTSIKPKSRHTNAWLAGYIDSDGYLSHKQECCDFGCNTKDRTALELIAKYTGREIKEGRENEIRLRHYFPRKNSTFAKSFLIPLLPHLILKRWDAEQILASYSTRREQL